MKTKLILTLFLLSVTPIVAFSQTTNEAYINRAKEFEAIATVYKESAEIANNAVMNLERIDPSKPIMRQSNMDEAVKAERIANFQKQMYLDHLEVSANYLTAVSYYKKTGNKELVEAAEKEVRKYYSLAFRELAASGEAYSIAADRYDKEKQAEKAIDFKRKQAEILKILVRETGSSN